MAASSSGIGPGRGGEEEDAAILKLGPGVHLASQNFRYFAARFFTALSHTPLFAFSKTDFGKSSVTCLANAEVAFLLEKKREMMQAKGILPPKDFLKAYQYVNTVKQFRDKEVMNQVRS